MIAIDATPFDCRYYHGGVSRYLQEVLSGLDNYGNVPILAVTRNIPEEIQLFLKKLNVSRYHTKQKGLFWRDSVAHQLKNNGIRALWTPSQFGPWSKNMTRILTLHDLSAFHAKPCSKWHENFYMKCSLRNAINQSDFIIAISNSTKDDLLNKYPYLESRTFVAKHGLPSDVREYCKHNEVQNNFKDQERDKFRYLFLDGGNPIKRIDICIKAIEKLGWNNRLLYVTGDYESIVKRIGRNIHPNIHILGRLERRQLIGLISQSDMLIYFSDYEGFGFPILESLALKTTVLTFSGKAELEVGGSYVISSNKFCHDEICQSLLCAENLCRDQSWMKKLQDYAHGFTWDASIQTHEFILRNAITNLQ
jgi:glycosyltransferase involved in cell wall biosynthesis